MLCLKNRHIVARAKASGHHDIHCGFCAVVGWYWWRSRAPSYCLPVHRSTHGISVTNGGIPLSVVWIPGYIVLVVIFFGTCFMYVDDRVNWMIHRLYHRSRAPGYTYAASLCYFIICTVRMYGRDPSRAEGNAITSYSTCVCSTRNVK